jgi:monofunctional biosynthetic peptidoglycan transglycosylase
MAPPRSLARRIARALAWTALALIGLFVALVLFDAFEPPVSTLMIARMVEGKSYERRYVRLAEVAPALLAAVTASEDARFCDNDGVDWGALHEVLRAAGAHGPSRGASTITMQTAKNLFLWPGRSAVRKGIEIVIALILGKVWSKAHTMEVYLNVAEWGDGLFGIESAAQRYFHKKASELDAEEAALLATSLPNPIRRDPAHPSWSQRRLAAAVLARARADPGRVACLAR